MQRKALIDALKIVYYLTKQEIPLTTNYEPILELAINLGCDCLRKLEVGANARYRSHAIIGEFLKVLVAVVEEQQFSALKYSDYFCLLTDKSTNSECVSSCAPVPSIHSWSKLPYSLKFSRLKVFAGYDCTTKILSHEFFTHTFMGVAICSCARTQRPSIADV